MNSPSAFADALLAGLAADDIQLLRDEPITAIELLYDIEVELVPPGNVPVGCGVSGQYIFGPPHRIIVAEADQPERVAFTALHELGHHLVGLNPQVAAALSAMVKGGRRAEERTVNLFAARTLIPDDLSDRLLGEGVTADAVAQLRKQAKASLRACCIRATDYVNADGFVVVARDGKVIYAEPSGTVYPVGTGGVHPGEHILVRAASEGAFRHSPVRLIDRHGVESREFAGDAVSDGRLVIAVFSASDNPAWGRVWTGYDKRPIWLEVECERCDRRTWGRERCAKCGEPICADDTTGEPCGWCSCRSQHRFTERRCAGPCGLLKHISQFIDGDDRCTDCR